MFIGHIFNGLIVPYKVIFLQFNVLKTIVFPDYSWLQFNVLNTIFFPDYSWYGGKGLLSHCTKIIGLMYIFLFFYKFKDFLH